MDFALTDEQKMLQDTAYKFAVKEFKPIAKECDRKEHYPKELIKKVGDLGFIGTMVPEKYGGTGLGWTEHAMIVEQFSRVDLGLTIVAVSTMFGSENILLYGTEEQRQKYLPKLVTGELISAGAYTEPNAGTDVAATKTRAVKSGDEWVINGSKMFITNGTVADFFVVLCVTDPDNQNPHKRHSIIIVEGDRPGISRHKIHGKMGIRASDTAEIFFEDVRVPVENLVGEQGNGFKQLMHFFDMTRIGVASQGVGLAQGVLDNTLRYVQERKVFGKTLAVNQGIQFQLAEMATKIELARNITYKAAWVADQGIIDPKLNAMAKYFSGEVAVWVADKGLHLHGGYGYIDEYDVQRSYRDAKIIEIYEGAKEVEKMVIAKRLF